MKTRTKNYITLGLILFLAVIGGGIGAVSKVGLQSMDPLGFTLVRFILASLVLLPVLWFKEKHALLPKSNMNKLIFVSALATVNITLFILGIKYTTATISQTLYAAVPLISAVIAFTLYRERLSRKKELGLAIGFLGVLLIIFLPLIHVGSGDNGTILGNMLIFTAVFAVSFYFVMSKDLQKTYSPLSITTAFALLTVVTQLLLIVITGGQLPNLGNLTASGVASVLYTGILGTGIYYLLYQYVIKIASPVSASLTLYLQPVSGAVWAAILLGEKLTGGFLIGAVLSLAGVYIVTNSD